MFAGSGDTVFAVGNRAPVFVRQHGIWGVYPLSRKGSAAANSGPLPIIALRRQLYQLGPTGWRGLSNAPAAVTHLWAPTPSHIFLSDRNNQLWETRGSGWQRIASPLAPGVSIAGIFGLRNSVVVARTSEGHLLSLGKRGATRLAQGALGPELRIQAVGVANGMLMAAGTLQTKNVLMQVGPTGLSEVAELWPLQPGDSFAVVTSFEKRLLVATKKGQVRVQQPDKAWRNAKVTKQQSIAPKAFPNSGPAQAH